MSRSTKHDGIDRADQGADSVRPIRSAGTGDDEYPFDSDADLACCGEADPRDINSGDPPARSGDSTEQRPCQRSR